MSESAMSRHQSDVEVDVAVEAGKARAVAVDLSWVDAGGMPRKVAFRMKASQARTFGLALLTKAREADRAAKGKAHA